MRPSQMLEQTKGVCALGKKIESMEDLDDVMSSAMNITSKALDQFFYAPVLGPKYQIKEALKESWPAVVKANERNGVVVTQGVLNKWNTDSVLLGNFREMQVEPNEELKLNLLKAEAERINTQSGMDFAKGWVNTTLETNEFYANRKDILSDKDIKKFEAFGRPEMDPGERVSPIMIFASKNVLNDLDIFDCSHVLVANPAGVDKIRAEENLRNDNAYPEIKDAIYEVTKHSFLPNVFIGKGDKMKVRSVQRFPPEKAKTVDLALSLSQAELNGKILHFESFPYLVERNVPFEYEFDKKSVYAELPASVLKKYRFLGTGNPTPGKSHEIILKGVGLIDLEFAEAFPKSYSVWRKEQNGIIPKDKLRIIGEARDYDQEKNFLADVF
jgi:hypothetical protein